MSVDEKKLLQAPDKEAATRNIILIFIVRIRKQTVDTEIRL